MKKEDLEFEKLSDEEILRTEGGAILTAGAVVAITALCTGIGLGFTQISAK